jgi:hypothetical protein
MRESSYCRVVFEKKRSYREINFSCSVQVKLAYQKIKVITGTLCLRGIQLSKQFIGKVKNDKVKNNKIYYNKIRIE